MKEPTIKEKIEAGKRLSIFFDGKANDLRHVMDVLRSKYKEYILNKWDLPDYYPDEKWIYNLACGIMNRPPYQTGISWIWKQFKEKEREEFKQEA